MTRTTDDVMSNSNKIKGISAFISYRRSSGREIARNLYERLAMNGINTFFDYNSMRGGKFNEQIYTAIEQASDFILIMTKDTLDRCVNDDDWVRIEIEHALKHNKNIIIVSTETEIKFPDHLPDSLIELPKYHAITLSQEYYDESVNRIIGMLSKVPNKKINKRFIIWGSIIFLIPICFLIYKRLGINWNLSEKSDITKGDFTSKVYLPRYQDINREVLDAPFFHDNTLDMFSYNDTIIGENYIIYPRSAFLTTPYDNNVSIANLDSLYFHSLPLRLRLYNPKSKTIIITGAEVELSDIRPIDFLFVSLTQTGNRIIARNEDNSILPEYEIKYSHLAQGESFVGYKKSDSISNIRFEIKQPDSNRTIGEILYNDYCWKFNTELNSAFEYEPTPSSNIDPASNDSYVKVIPIETMAKSQTFKLDDFHRKLVKGEIDDNIFLFLSTKRNFEANLKIKVSTIDNQTIDTNNIKIIVVSPKYFNREPF